MVSPKVLTKLNPKSPSLEIGLGGEPEITWEMVAACKGYMSPMVSAYAELAWNEHYRHETKMALFSHFKIKIKNIIRKHWRDTDLDTWDQMSEKLAFLLIDEILSQYKRCTACNGVESRKVNDAVIRCPTCKGIGKKLFTGRQKASRVGISHTSWQRTWEVRYSNYLIPMVSDLHGQMMKELNKHLNVGT